MKPHWEMVADEVLGVLQQCVTARDRTGLLDLFEDPAVLVGANGDGRTIEGRIQYLTNITEQDAEVRWAWAEKHVFYDTEAAVGFAAFGEIVVTAEGIESCLPFRLTLFVSRTDARWRIRQFHGSVPLSPTND